MVCVSGGNELGNGGDTFEKEDGTLYSLDLVEFGLENNPFITDNIVSDPQIAKILEKFLVKFDTSTREVVAQKLTRLRKNWPNIYENINPHLVRTRIIFVDSELKYLDDVASPLQGKSVRLGSHNQHFIRFNERGIKKLVSTLVDEY